MDARFQDIQARADRVLAATSPIYSQAEDGRIEGVGTGIFFTHEGLSFVLSAAHVLIRLRDERLLIGGDHLIQLNERFFTSPENDVDLGFVPLSDAQIVELRGAQYLTIDDVDAVHDAGERQPYYVTGFRTVDNAPDGSPTAITSIGSAYVALAAPPDSYPPLGLSPNTHLVLNFDRERLYSSANTRDEEPEPEGLSGSGVWRLMTDPTSDKLVAVVIEHSNAQRVLISTRIAPLLDSLAAYNSGDLT